MKRQIYIGMGISCLLLSMVSAKTWTSAEGDKTFSGEFKSYDEASKSVTVTRGYKKQSFALDILSEEDRNWVLAKVKADAAAAAADSVSLADQKIGSKLTSKVLTRLKGKRLARAEMTKKPEYYILYFSASW